MNANDWEFRWQRREIERAGQGCDESRWLVLKALYLKLHDQNNDRYSRLIDFVERLLDIKDAAGAKGKAPTRGQLSAALNSLGVTRRSGQRAPDEAAWSAVALMVNELRVSDVPVLHLAADFLAALMAIRAEALNGMPELKQLAVALDRLHVVAPRGRSKTSDREILGRLAAEKIEAKRYKSVAVAREVLADGELRLGELRQRDIRTENPELAAFVDDATPKELEGLADNLFKKK